ncbi:MAG TPA: MmgE/PrpD family protein [Burkholderiales bacterium]|nr:MmgE/PrpD family protein [Burkholderiales bacterium]
MNETRTLAEFVARLRYEDLPQAVVEQACRIVVDTVGCALSAWTEDPAKSRIALDIAKLYGSDQGASVIGVAGVKSQPRKRGQSPAKGDELFSTQDLCCNVVRLPNG